MRVTLVSRMSALTSLLVRDTVVPVDVIEDALQRQVLEGGDVDTALLEIAAVSENTLNGYRATTFGLAPVAREELMGVSDDTLKLISVELAREYRLVPLVRSGNTLSVCAAQPLAPEQHLALERAIGLAVVLKIAVWVRVEAALATFYGVDIPTRMRDLADQLDHAPAGVLPTVSAPEGMVFHLDGDLLRAFDSQPPSMVESAYTEDSVQPHPLDQSVQGAIGIEAGLDDGAEEKGGVDIDVDGQPIRRTITAEFSRSKLKPFQGQSGTGPESAPEVVLPRLRPHFRRVSMVPKGPLSPDRARELLEKAQDRDAVIDIFFSFARQYFDCCALFTVRKDHLVGLEAYGVLGVEAVSALDVGIGAGGAIRDVVSSMLPRVTNLDRAAFDQPLLEMLGRTEAQPAVLVPIVIRQRVITLLYGDRDGDPLHLDELADLLGALPTVVRALERIIHNRKLYAIQAARVQERGDTQPSVESNSGLRTGRTAALGGRDAMADDPLETRIDTPIPAAEALSALGLSRPAPSLPDLSIPPPARGAPDPALELSQSRSKRPASSGPSRSYRPPAPPPDIHVASGTAGPGESASVRRVSEKGWSNRPADESRRPAERLSATPARAFRRPAALSTKPPPGAGVYQQSSLNREERVLLTPQASDPLIAEADILSEVQELGDERSHVHQSSQEGAARDARSRGFEDFDGPVDEVTPVGDLDVIQERALSTVPPPNALSRRAASGRAGSERPPEVVRVPDRLVSTLSEPPKAIVEAKAHAETKVPPSANIPSIIVDMGDEVNRLVDELCRCGPDDEGPAVEALRRVGEAALPALVERFPGPLWFDRRSPHKQVASGRDVSAVARALAGFGEMSAPYVAGLLAAANADVRYYATLLVIDDVLPAHVSGLANAVFDSDPQVRIGARQGLAKSVGMAGFDAAVAEIRTRASDPRGTVQQRLDAIEALVAVRDPGAIHILIELNGYRDRQLAVPAHRALMLITGRDFGASTRKWEAFAAQVHGKSRVEWLIDGLMQSDVTQRATSGTELQKLTQVYYGYVASASKRDRERVQRRYLEWYKERA